MNRRRREILRAADRLVAEQGIKALTVRNVAARTGIGASTLRYYFPTQQDLYTEVLGRTFDAQLDDLNIADRTLSPTQRLTECMTQFLPATDADVPQLAGWLRMYTATLEPDGPQTRLLSAFGQRARTRVDAWLATLDGEGALRPGSRNHHTLVLLAMIDGLCLGLITPDTPFTLEHAKAVLVDVVAGVVVDESTRTRSADDTS